MGRVGQNSGQSKRNFAAKEIWDTVGFMKSKMTWKVVAAMSGFCFSAWARSWQTPVMATWTEDPRTTVTLAWERHGEGTARVEYGEWNGAAKTASVQEEPVRRHVFTLRGLKPGTKYAYTATSSDGFEARGHFWTAPSDPHQAFTFVLHNDLQGGINEEAAKAVSAGVVAANPDFVALSAEEVLGKQGVSLACGERLRLFPHRHGTDGFFAAVMEKK